MQVLITGVSSGIGYYCALVFAQNGYHVWGTIRKTSKVPKFPKEITKNITLIYMDITSDISVSQGIHKIYDKTKGNIDLLINNAGHIISGSIEETSLSQSIDLFQVNFFGHLRVLKEVIHIMRAWGKGKIININALSVHFPVPFYAHYAATKSAFESVSKVLRLELRAFNIQTTSILSGWIKTNFIHKTKAYLAAEKYSSYGRYFHQIQKQVQRSLTNGIDPNKLAVRILKIAGSKKLKPHYYFSSFMETFKTCLSWFTTTRIVEILEVFYFKLLNKRRHSRLPVNKLIDMSSNNRIYQIHLINISRKGLLCNYLTVKPILRQSITILTQDIPVRHFFIGKKHKTVRIVFRKKLSKTDFSILGKQLSEL